MGWPLASFHLCLNVHITALVGLLSFNVRPGILKKNKVGKFFFGKYLWNQRKWQNKIVIYSKWKLVVWVPLYPFNILLFFLDLPVGNIDLVIASNLFCEIMLYSLSFIHWVHYSYILVCTKPPRNLVAENVDHFIACNSAVWLGSACPVALTGHVHVFSASYPPDRGQPRPSPSCVSTATVFPSL